MQQQNTKINNDLDHISFDTQQLSLQMQSETMLAPHKQMTYHSTPKMRRLSIEEMDEHDCDANDNDEPNYDDGELLHHECSGMECLTSADVYDDVEEDGEEEDMNNNKISVNHVDSVTAAVNKLKLNLSPYNDLQPIKQKTMSTSIFSPYTQEFIPMGK